MNIFKSTTMHKDLKNIRSEHPRKRRYAKAIIVFAGLAICLTFLMVLPYQAHTGNEKSETITTPCFGLAVVMSPQRLKNMKEQMESAQKDKRPEDTWEDAELIGFRKQIAESPTGVVLSFFLPIVAIGGFVALLIAHLVKATPPPFLGYVFPRIYVVCAVAYAVWLAHLLFGLPIFLSIEIEFCGIIGVGIALVLILWYVKKILERREALATGQYQVCPHCKELVVRLAIVCPNCNKPIVKAEEKK